LTKKKKKKKKKEENQTGGAAMEGKEQNVEAHEVCYCKNPVKKLIWKQSRLTKHSAFFPFLPSLLLFFHFSSFSVIIRLFPFAQMLFV
jgi:hypothetical protein